MRKRRDELYIVFLIALFLLCGSQHPLFAKLSGPHRSGHEHAVSSDDKQHAEAAADRLRERLMVEYAQKANRVTDHYVKAQQAFYQGRHQLALQEINSALELIDNADLLAFKGAIYYGMGLYDEAHIAFARAFSLDKTLPIPKVEGLIGWLTEKQLIK